MIKMDVFEIQCVI